MLKSLHFIYDHLKEGKTITKLEDNFENTFNIIQEQIRENLLVNIGKINKNESLLSKLVDFANKIMEVRVAAQTIEPQKHPVENNNKKITCNLFFISKDQTKSPVEIIVSRDKPRSYPISIFSDPSKEFQKQIKEKK